MKALMIPLWIAWMGLGHTVQAADLRLGNITANKILFLGDKTLVAWVAPANLEQRGGSALTLDAGQGRFDGIIFGEITPGKWMPGSEGFCRTFKEQGKWPDETADGKTFVQVAITYKDRQITIYRNGGQYAQYTMDSPPLEFGPQSMAIFGLRHERAVDGQPFRGSIEDARIYDRALTAEEIRKLEPDKESDIKPYAWWTFEKGQETDRMGRFPVNNLAGWAKIEGGRLILNSGMLIAGPPVDKHSLSVRFKPVGRAVGDVMPYYYKGEYHVFYLTNPSGPWGVNWEHAVSKDLVHWKNLPAAILYDPNDRTGPEGCCMFTGSIIEDHGTFHAFYTGWNPDNPAGREFIGHATSKDLISWTKHPEDRFGPDGIHYANHRERDFRDPCVVWDAEQKQYVMWVNANKPDKPGFVFGVLTSRDLKKWEQLPAIEDVPGNECPDIFKSGETYYMLCNGTYAFAKNRNGPWKFPSYNRLDRTMAAKRLFDGKRHVWFGGWLNGGCMSIPREVYEGSDGWLFMKPVPEVVNVFNKVALSVTNLSLTTGTSWKETVPQNYLLEATLDMSKAQELSLIVRGGNNDGDSIVLSAEKKALWGRPLPIDFTRPVTLQAFIVDGVAEVFVNDKFAETCFIRPVGGTLSLEAQGSVVVQSLRIKTDEYAREVTAAQGAAARRADIAIADFEADTYGVWKVTGEAFGAGPVAGAISGQNPVSNYQGKRLVNSFHNGDATTGTLTSPPFSIQRKNISFLVGGGNHPNETCMNLIVDGRIARTVTGPDNERLEPGGWDVREFAGKPAILQIVDSQKGGWGHIAVDQIVQTDNEIPKKMSMAYECPSVNKRFMHIPIDSSGARNSWVNISVDGVWQRELSISLASDNPDSYATLEVGQWKGKKLTLTAEDVYSTSKWSELIKLSDEMSGEATVYTEKYRPQFHFTVRRSGLGDANGLVYLNGEYHLFGQHWPFRGASAIDPISMVWAHAISTDLVHWVEYPVAIWPDKLGVPFSGSGVVDWKNTAGLVKNPVMDKNGRLKNPAIVLFYTSEPMFIRTGGSTTQSMVYSLDSGRTWIPYAGNPVVPYIVKENRDPKVFWYEDRKHPGNPYSGRWIMVLFLSVSGQDYALLASKDLIHWERTSVINNIGFWECPDMFELPVDGDKENTRWVLRGPNGSYIIGRFDGQALIKESGPISDYAGREYAAQTFSDIPEEDGRRIQMANLDSRFPGMPFAGQLTFPRVLTLRTTSEGIRLFMEPAKEIEKLRTGESLQIKGTLAGADASLKSDKTLGELVDAEAVFEIRSDSLPAGGPNVFGLKINGQTILCDLDQKQVKVLDLAAPLNVVSNKIKLRVIVDRMSIEVFVNDGACRFTRTLVPEDGMKPDIQVFGKQGLANVQLIAYQLQSIWKKKTKQ